MAITYHTQGCEFALKGQTKSSAWIRETIHQEGFRCSAISIIFCSDEALLAVNREFLQHDYFTDIITFDYSNHQRKLLSGDLMISIDTVRSNAASLGVSFMEELHRVMIHGVLHMAGYGDKEGAEAQIMRSKEDHYLRAIELRNLETVSKKESNKV